MFVNNIMDLVSAVDFITAITGAGKDPTEISFVLDALPKTSLYLSRLRNLFSLSDLFHDKPHACPEFSGLKVISIKGTTIIEIEEQIGKKASLFGFLDAYIESTDRIPTLENSLNTLKTTSLRLQYKKSTYSGQVYDHLKINGIGMWVYFKDAEGKQIFLSSSTKLEELDSMPFNDLANSFIPNPAEYDIPDALEARRRLKMNLLGLGHQKPPSQTRCVRLTNTYA